MQNYYEILGVAREAKQADIKSAFKKLALKFHPDKNPNNPVAEELFKNINEAYQTLGDENKRWAYNQKLNTQHYQNQREAPKAEKFSTQGTSTTYNKYNWTAPNSAAGDYSNQGKHYQEPAPKPKEKKSDSYVLAFTLFVIIATGALLFGFMMNKIAAKEHYKDAVSLYEQSDYVPALMELNLAIDFQEDFTEAHILRGDINVKLNRIQPALVDYNRAIKFSKTIDNELVTKRDMCKLILESH